jgi:hypothetical protein
MTETRVREIAREEALNALEEVLAAAEQQLFRGEQDADTAGD